MRMVPSSLISFPILTYHSFPERVLNASLLFMALCRVERSSGSASRCKRNKDCASSAKWMILFERVPSSHVCVFPNDCNQVRRESHSSRCVRVVLSSEKVFCPSAQTGD